MIDYFRVHAYVDKMKNIVLVPYKMCKAGYAVATGPYKELDNTEWENVSKYIVELMKVIAEHPLAEEKESERVKAIFGNSGFKQFSKNIFV